ncbi:Zinc finger MYM-type protein 1 like protein [Argiope bruennichi]|uniref:Zinc finger MYM-type protein 1 like protein n=1 Tax=Argiope bruennichi TaxID=94029 RepID=A0A8T0FPQ3_ARGBR|nr:Zinc finger MYM-type protein 1 like protein [Argiope bruennichi]
MIKSSKYYSLILDTTPDVSHTEQLTVVIRFVYRNEETNKAQIEEHFLGFQSVDDTTGQGLFELINGHLKSLELNLSDLRGQSYDNGANMRGKHKGLQQKIIESNSRAL